MGKINYELKIKKLCKRNTIDNLELGLAIYEYKHASKTVKEFHANILEWAGMSKTVANKWVSIGSKYDVLKAHTDYLPISYSAIAEIALLENSEIISSISSGDIDKRSTAEQMKELRDSFNPNVPKGRKPLQIYILECEGHVRLSWSMDVSNRFLVAKEYNPFPVRLVFAHDCITAKNLSELIHDELINNHKAEGEGGWIKCSGRLAIEVTKGAL